MAGADAVYLGLNDFSARTEAENFSVAELGGVVAESHRAGVKIYLAFNSLLKEAELPLAYRLLDTAAGFGIDAAIIQDLGLARLARKRWPRLELHASTLTAVHNLDGLRVLAKLGFKRAVLARELNLEEIAGLSLNSPLETEIFIHGALCFSFSGLCLMSSFLGGKSALRGACVQPCRRVYQNGPQKGAFFSAADLAGAPLIKELRKLPVASFKIEGRMKTPDYVSRVVKAYRLLLNVSDQNWPEALAEATSLLREAPGRRPSLGGLEPGAQGLLQGGGDRATSGTLAGRAFLAADKAGLRLVLKTSLTVGDRLRLAPPDSLAGLSFNLKEIISGGRTVEQAGPGAEVVVNAPSEAPAAGFLYKVSSGAEEKAALASPLVKAVKMFAQGYRPGPFKNTPSELKSRPVSRASEAAPVRRLGVWLMAEKAETAFRLAALTPKRLVIPLTPANAREVMRHKKRWSGWLDKLVWRLPALMFYQELLKLKKEAAYLIKNGARRFMAANIGAIGFLGRFGESLEIWGDHRLGVLNHLQETALIQAGLTGVTFSLENDGPNLDQLWAAPPPGQRLLYLFGRPPLFTSRFQPRQIKPRAPLISPKGERFLMSHEGAAFTWHGEQPVFMGPLLKRPPLPGSAGLLIDLAAQDQPEKTAAAVLRALASGRPLPGGGSAFNLKRGLR